MKGPHFDWQHLFWYLKLKNIEKKIRVKPIRKYWIRAPLLLCSPELAVCCVVLCCVLYHIDDEFSIYLLMPLIMKEIVFSTQTVSASIFPILKSHIYD